MMMSPQIQPADELLTLEEVKAIAKLGKTMIYRLMRAGQFPQSCKAGGCSTRWSRNEVQAWVQRQLDTRQAA